MKQRKCYLSLARIICAFAVVMIHTNGCFQEFNVAGCWPMANLIDCGLGFAVPIFIMISGATLIDYSERYDTKRYFINRIKKALIPYVIWSIIGSIYGAKTGYDGIFFIYYFFLNLFGVYLCIPLFSFIQKEYKEKVIFYVVVVSFIINYFLPFVCQITNRVYVYKIPFEIGSNFLIYALIGYLISKNELSPTCRLISYIGSVIGFGLHIGGTYFASVNSGFIVDTYRGYTNLPCLLSAVGMFVLIKQVGSYIKNEKLIGVIEWVSSYTFAVYLLHYYVINSLVLRFVIDTHSLTYRLGTPVLTFSLCVLIAWIVRKIPIVKNILP